MQYIIPFPCGRYPSLPNMHFFTFSTCGIDKIQNSWDILYESRLTCAAITTCTCSILKPLHAGDIQVFPQCISPVSFFCVLRLSSSIWIISKNNTLIDTAQLDLQKHASILTTHVNGSQLEKWKSIYFFQLLLN